MRILILLLFSLPVFAGNPYKGLSPEEGLRLFKQRTNANHERAQWKREETVRVVTKYPELMVLAQEDPIVFSQILLMLKDRGKRVDDFMGEPKKRSKLERMIEEQKKKHKPVSA